MEIAFKVCKWCLLALFLIFLTLWASSFGNHQIAALSRTFCLWFFWHFPESPVTVKMRIRHYFSHFSASASYDVRQGFDKQFDLIEDCYDQRRCQTLQHPPRKPTRSNVQSRTTPRSSSVPALGPPALLTDKTKVSSNTTREKITWAMFDCLKKQKIIQELMTYLSKNFKYKGAMRKIQARLDQCVHLCSKLGSICLNRRPTDN